MPITKSALKALRKTKRKAKINKPIRLKYQTEVKLFRKKPKILHLAKVYRVLDMAVKKKVIHANKAARLKSRLSKLLKTKAVKAPAVKK